MRTITKEVYTFDELSEKAKEKARAWWLEDYDMPFLSDDMHEMALELLKENGIKTDDIKVYYSLAYCQGDGAMIEFSGEWDGKHVMVKQCGHYSHERSTDIEVYTEDDEGNREYVDYKDFEENVYVPMCIKLRDFGYSAIEAERSDDVVDENIRANDYEFYADGSSI